MFSVFSVAASNHKVIMLSTPDDPGVDNHYICPELQPIDQHIGGFGALERPLLIETASNRVEYETATGLIRNLLMYTSGKRVQQNLPLMLASNSRDISSP